MIVNQTYLCEKCKIEWEDEIHCPKCGELASAIKTTEIITREEARTKYKAYIMPSFE